MEGFGVHTFRLVNERGHVAVREVPLEARARRALGAVGRGAEDLRARIRTFSGAICGRRSRAAHSRSGSSGCRSSRRRTSTRSSSTCWIRPRSCRRSWCRCKRVGRLVARPEPRQLLRRDGAGRLSSRPHRARHRFHQRSAAAGPAVLVHRHPAHPPRRAQLPRDPDQPAGGAPSTTTSATDSCARRINVGPVELSPQLAGRRMSDAGGPRAGRIRQLPGAASTARRCGPAARSSSTTSARRRCSGTASPRRSRSISCRPSASSSARSTTPADPRADAGHARPGRQDSGRPRRKASGCPCPRAVDGPLNLSVPADRDPKDFQPRRFKQQIESVAGAEHGRHCQGHALRRGRSPFSPPTAWMRPRSPACSAS